MLQTDVTVLPRTRNVKITITVCAKDEGIKGETVLCRNLTQRCVVKLGSVLPAE